MKLNDECLTDRITRVTANLPGMALAGGVVEKSSRSIMKPEKSDNLNFLLCGGDLTRAVHKLTAKSQSRKTRWSSQAMTLHSHQSQKSNPETRLLVEMPRLSITRNSGFQRDNSLKHCGLLLKLVPFYNPRTRYCRFQRQYWKMDFSCCLIYLLIKIDIY